MELVRYEVKDRVAYLTLNRPDKRNALNGEMVAELTRAFEEAHANPRVKVVVLKASGKAFCAGADLAYLEQLQQNSYEENLQDSSQLAGLFKRIYTLNKVVIAQVQGHAIAGGCGLAIVCDFVFSVPQAKFGYTEVKIGFVPAIVSVFLVRKIGETRARELLLSGELISAEKAQNYNLINFVVEEYELEERVQTYAQNLCNTNSAQSMTITKQLIALVQETGIDRGLQLAAEQNARSRGSEDCQKGIAAFLNKEALKW